MSSRSALARGDLQMCIRDSPYRSKKALTGTVRLTEFPGADLCACCGTHVSGSGQVGLVKFLSCQKLREGVRLELVCGGRAMAHLCRCLLYTSPLHRGAKAAG